MCSLAYTQPSDRAFAPFSLSFPSLGSRYPSIPEEMTFAPSSAPASTEFVRAIGGHFDDGVAGCLRPLCIAESDCELQDWDIHKQFLAIPACIQERMISRSLQQQDPSISKLDFTPGNLTAWHSQDTTVPSYEQELLSSFWGHSGPPLESLGCLSSRWELETDSASETDNSLPLPMLSPGTSVASSPNDADDSRAPGKHPTPQGAGNASNNVPGGADGTPASGGQGRRGKKRNRAASDVMSSDHESQQSRPRRQRTEDRPRVILACPFYKWDPARYRNCRRILLTKISYVKQHILRAHRMPPHCQICNGSFQTDDQLRQHVRSMTCERRPYAPPDGVTEERMIQLRSRVNQKNSLENQWYEVFDILFPGSARPASVYLDPELSQDLDEFVNYLTTQGPGIILDRVALLGSGVEGGQGGHGMSGLAGNLSSALQEVYDRWYRERTTEDGLSTAPKPSTSNHDPPLLRPSPRNPPAATGHHNSLTQQDNSFGRGSLDGYGTLAARRIPPMVSWDTRNPMAPASQGGSAPPGTNPRVSEVEAERGRGGEEGPSGGRILGPPSRG